MYLVRESGKCVNIFFVLIVSFLHAQLHTINTKKAHMVNVFFRFFMNFIKKKQLTTNRRATHTLWIAVTQV